MFMNERTNEATNERTDKKVQSIFFCPYENKATRAEWQQINVTLSQTMRYGTGEDT